MEDIMVCVRVCRSMVPTSLLSCDESVFPGGENAWGEDLWQLRFPGGAYVFLVDKGTSGKAFPCIVDSQLSSAQSNLYVTVAHFGALRLAVQWFLWTSPFDVVYTEIHDDPMSSCQERPFINMFCLGRWGILL